MELLIAWLFTLIAIEQVYSTKMRRPLGNNHTSHEKQLVKALLAHYENVGRHGRPVANHSDIIEVKYSLNLIQIIDLDEKNQVLTLNVWDKYIWEDLFLQWDEEEYGNVTDVRIPADQIWTPDIKLYNYADDRILEHRNALAVVRSNGVVLWMPQAVYKSSCAIVIENFPFDIQTCQLKFGSWTYNGHYLNIIFADALEAMDLADYMPNKEWEILANNGTRNVNVYTCCPEPYIDLTFTLKLKRSAVIYNYILILPCVLLSTLTLVLFWIPPESPAKMQLGMNIFVAFFVLLLLLEESLPSASASIPLIGAFFCLNMVLITLSSFLNVLVVNLSLAGQHGPVPPFIKLFVVSLLGRILCTNCSPLPRRPKRVPPPRKPRPKQQIIVTTANGFTKWTTDTFNGTAESDALLDPNRSPGRRSYASTAESAIDGDVHEVARVGQIWLQRVQEQDRQDVIIKEWRAVALTLDRLFFFIYLSTIIVSLLTIFPKYEE